MRFLKELPNVILILCGCGLIVVSMFEKFNGESWFHASVLGILFIMFGTQK